MRRQKWKDELTPVVIAAVSQFVALRVVDWANANKETNENAANLVGKHFYYAPQILAVVIIFFTARSVKVYLDEQGIRLGSFLRQSVLAILLAAALIFVAHIDQLALVVGTFTGEKSAVGFAKALEASAFYGLLSRNAVLRLLIDLVALVITLVSLRYSKLPTGEGSGRSLEKAGDFLKAGEAYLKENNLKKAKAAFRKAKAPTRLAALELRDGNHREAARLFEEAGDTFAWEAALAWGEAGDREKAEAARVRALADARNMSRWDRLAEIADATGDVHMIAEASRRLAEGKPPGAGRTGLFRRAGDSFQQINQPVDAAEAYRGAGEYLLAAEMFMKAGRHADASSEFERGGDLGRAAQAAAAAGNGQRASELTARDAEARGDVTLAAQAWREAGQLERAASLFERKQLWFEAAEMWMSSKRPDKAAPLFQRAGRTMEAAIAYEEAGAADKAAPLFRELGHHDRAAILFRSAGRWVEAAQSLQIIGQHDEALGLFRRAGRGLDAARCALQLGRREQAWELVSGVPRGDANVRAFFVDLAEAHVQAGEYRDAVHVLREHLGSSPVTKESLRAHLLFARGLCALGEKDEGEFLISRIADVAPEAASELEADVARGALSVSHHPTRRLEAPVAASFVPGRTSGMHTPVPPAAPVPQAQEPPPQAPSAEAPADAAGTGAPAVPTVVRQRSASFAAPRPGSATGGQGHTAAASPTLHRATPAYGSPAYPPSSSPGSGSFPPLGLNVNAT
ncbi:MAG: hypothetical protein JNK60_23270, partial [Acidobacteria bacterium]|nr:hypothetical protein [Acidobacteriota bacterium]